MDDRSVDLDADDVRDALRHDEVDGACPGGECSLGGKDGGARVVGRAGDDGHLAIGGLVHGPHPFREHGGLGQLSMDRTLFQQDVGVDELFDVDFA